MPELFSTFPLLFAENAAAPSPNGGMGGMLGTPLLIAAMVLWGYLLLYRPQQQQEKKRRAMLEAIKKNDKVLTAGGIYGTIISVDTDQDKVVLRVDDDRGVRMAFTKASIVKVIDVAPEKEKAPEVA
jgi:preprotein translocase subunit YajC